MQIIQPSGSHRLGTLITLAAAIVGLLAAGCGGSGSHASTTPHAQSFINSAFKYSACMRDHGVTSFPDPQMTDQGGNQGVQLRLPAGLVSSPQFRGARADCQGILPMPQNANPVQSAQQRYQKEQDALSFARCMRGNGVSHFPDPDGEGQLTIEMVVAAGIDVHAQSVLAAVKTCLPAAHGALTVAGVRHALAEVP